MAQLEKADAAERLIVAAIGMVERGDEPLASHLVATSALNVLRDLMTSADAGQEYVTELSKRGMFYLAHARAKGEQIDLEVPDWVESQVEELSRLVEAGEISGPEELEFNHEKPWELLSYLMRPSNFLKHADRDPLDTLDEEDLDPEGAIVHALTAYSLVRPDKALPDQILPFLDRHDLV